MAKQNRSRRIGQLDYAANGVKSIDLPRATLYQYLSLRLSGAVTIATAAATAWADAPWSLIRRIEVIADGKDTIKSIDGETLAVFARIFSGTALSASAMPTDVGASQAFNAHLYLPFEMVRSIRPIDTLLNTKRLSTLELRVTWGDATSVYSANAGNATFANTAVEISLSEGFGIESDFGVFKQLTIAKDISAVTADFQILLPVGNMYRGFLVRALNYGASPANVDPGTPSNAIINNLSLKSGTEVFINRKSTELQDDNKRMYGLEAWPAGCYVIEFTPDGLLTEMLDARALSSLEMILDVSNPATTNRVKVYPLEVIAPPAPLPK